MFEDVLSGGLEEEILEQTTGRFTRRVSPEGGLDRDLAPEVQALTTILETATALAHFYALCTAPEERKALLRHVFARIMVSDRTITTIEYHPPFHLLLGEPAREGSRVDLERRVLDYLAAGGLEGTVPRWAA